MTVNVTMITLLFVDARGIRARPAADGNGALLTTGAVTGGGYNSLLLGSTARRKIRGVCPGEEKKRK